MTAASSGTPLTISVLALVVAILAVFFGPLIARANVQRQIQVASREAWMREFREQVAQFLTSVMRGVRTEAGMAAPAEEIRSATLCSLRRRPNTMTSRGSWIAC
jgi:hypothetical protein